MSDDIVRVGSKVLAFRRDHPITEFGILTDFTEDEVGGVARVVGRCRIVHLASGRVVALAYGTRALRVPVPGAQGHRDTRDPDRAMTQATGRALGLLGYAGADSIEGDTDEPDNTGVTVAAPPADRPLTVAAAKKRLVALLGTRPEVSDAKAEAGDLWKGMGFEGRGHFTVPELEQAVVDWFAHAEPFDSPAPPDPPANVDPATGEVTA